MNDNTTDRQVRPEHYDSTAYDSLGRFNSYWHQIDEILKSRPASLLEVGVGNRFVADYLVKQAISVTSVDIDLDLGPSAVASIMHLPFDSERFDVAMCCQVLEHLPYPASLAALGELNRVTRRHLLISVPDRSYYYGFHLQIPGLGRKQFGLSSRRIPKLTAPLVADQHYWEIGMAGYESWRFEHDLRAAGFQILKNYRVHLMPFHRFFLLACA